VQTERLALGAKLDKRPFATKYIERLPAAW
jgi:hypothetical protein